MLVVLRFVMAVAVRLYRARRGAVAQGPAGRGTAVLVCRVVTSWGQIARDTIGSGMAVPVRFGAEWQDRATSGLAVEDRLERIRCGWVRSGGCGQMRTGRAWLGGVGRLRKV